MKHMNILVLTGEDFKAIGKNFVYMKDCLSRLIGLLSRLQSGTKSYKPLTTDIEMCKIFSMVAGNPQDGIKRVSNIH